MAKLVLKDGVLTTEEAEDKANSSVKTYHVSLEPQVTPASNPQEKKVSRRDGLGWIVASIELGLIIGILLFLLRG